MATILIIDDDPNISLLLKVNLENAGYAVIRAGDGIEGVALALREKPALIILDIMMPNINGFEVCRRLRENNDTSLIPVIMLSARGQPLDKITGLKLGADDYITKPFDIDELFARIDSRLKRIEQFMSANPLTGLPGNVSIMIEANKRLAGKSPFSFLYIDIDNFKAYNDTYGFSNGDSAISFTADIIKSNVLEGDFTGHIGGDDFFVFTAIDRGETLCRKIMSSFDKGRDVLYSEADLKLGTIRAKSRDGTMQQYPFMALSIGVGNALPGKKISFGKIVELATELKNSAKQRYDKTTSGYRRERRDQ
jgi:diguanylate cyclase (GGDEF)-like protein